MILRDTLRLGSKTFKAHVGTVRIDEYRRELDDDDNQMTTIRQVEQLTALVKPSDDHKKGAVYTWRGDDYIAMHEPLIRRRNGRDHHYTLYLERDT